MWNPTEGWLPTSSYVEPVPPPDAEPDGAPVVCLTVSKAWLPYILGSLAQLVQPTTWDTSDPTVRQTALDRATALIEQFGTAEECMPVEFRLTEACVLQFSVDGGTTWEDVDGWVDFAASCFTGATGDTGPEGPAGPAPTFRLNDCVLQVSTDGGSTWTDVAGWDTFSAACIPPAPPSNPLDSDTATLACSIATYMATNVINAGIQHVVDQINLSKTLVQTVTSFLGLAFVIDVPVAITLDIAALAFNVIQGLNLTDLQTGLDDSTYFEAVQCAIFNAISSDGMITAANWASVQTAIDAVTAPNAATASAVSSYVDSMSAATGMYLQQQGPVYEGICNCSGSWCMEWDFTVSAGPWTTYLSHTTWASGQGFVGGYNAGGSPPNTEMAIKVPMPSHTPLTYIEWTFTSPNGINSAISFITLEQGGSTAYFTNFGTGVHTSPFTWSLAPAANGDFLYIVLRGNGNNAGQKITHAKLKGTGTNPFGVDNCAV